MKTRHLIILLVVILSLVADFLLGVNIVSALTIMFFAFFQNIAFSVVSRSRNRDNIDYHIIAAVFSNGVWFLTFKFLITNNMDLLLFIPYCIGTVAGSVWGVKISMFIEKKLNARSDSHLGSKG